MYCMLLAAAGRMTDGFSPFAKEQKLILVRASAVAEWPAWESAYLSSTLLLTAC